MKTLLLLLASILITCGCASNPSNAPQAKEKKPKHYSRVKVAIYDTTPRTATTQLDYFAEGTTIPKQHKVIALLTCEGAAHEEGEMVNAINFRARELGASGVIQLRADQPNASVAIAHPMWQAPDRRVFRANAIIYLAQ